MKEQIIELINKCISNKDYLLNPIKTAGSYSTGVMYESNKVQDRWQYENKYPRLNEQITSFKGRHKLLFVFTDSPSINIYSRSSDEVIGEMIVYTKESFLGFSYPKKHIVKTCSREYTYILSYGELKFELPEYQVNDIVADYQRNLEGFRQEKYTEQIKQRIEKYS